MSDGWRTVAGELVEWAGPSRNVRVGVSRTGGAVTVHVAGELDVASAPVVARALQGGLVEQSQRVVLDLSRVTFCGMAGVDLLLDARRSAAEAGGALMVARAHSAVVLPLETCREPEAWLIAEEVRTAPLPEQEWRRRKSVVSAVLTRAFQITGAPMGNAQLYEPAGEALRIVAQRGFRHPFLSFFETVSDRETACGAAARDHRPVVVEEVVSSPIFAGSPALDVLVDAEVGAVISLPVTTRDGTLLGVASVHQRRATAWPAAQRRSLAAVARAACLQ
ncbi:STAS domain-containing protein [Streptomyces sp. NPDC059070]|uniref:STAS domain-containing protein n=1 Tax=unclassified Streptomyces TaxID=2593676 RepID=UPI0034E1EEE7